MDAQRSISAILESARAILADDPTVSMAEVADRSGVHRSTLHRHFPSRDSLISSLATAAAESFSRRVDETDVEAGGALAALRRLTTGMLEEANVWGVTRYAPLATIAAGQGVLGFRAKVLGVIDRGQREGELRTDVAAPDLYASLVGLVISWGALRQTKPEPDEVADAILRTLFPQAEPVVLTVLPMGRTGDAPARLVLEASGDVQMRLNLDGLT